MKGKKQDNHNEGDIQKGKKKGIFIGLLIFFLIIVLLFVGVVIKARISNSKNNIKPAQIEEVDQEAIVKSDEEDQEDGGPSIEENEEEEVEGLGEVEEVFDYGNKLVGIKFNYATDMYIKENTEGIFNTLKSITKEGENFNILEDRMPELLNIVKLTTGNSDGLFITVNLIPFSMVQETKEEIETESVEVIPTLDETMLKDYDEGIKKTIEDNGGNIGVFESSYIIAINDNKVIISERKYSGAVDLETTTGVVDVIQGLIPVGRNAILITVVTDGRPLEIDKVNLFEEIIDSIIIVKTEPILEEVVNP